MLAEYRKKYVKLSEQLYEQLESNYKMLHSVCDEMEDENYVEFLKAELVSKEKKCREECSKGMTELGKENESLAKQGNTIEVIKASMTKNVAETILNLAGKGIM